MIKLTKIGWNVFYSSEKKHEVDVVESSLKYFDDNSRFTNSEYWDGYKRYYDKRKRCFNFGHLSYVVNRLIQSKVNYEISGIDIDIFQPNTKYNKKLHAHQLAALYSFFDTKHGAIKVPTRGGKTYIASEAIRLINHKNPDNITLFFTDSQLLFDQAKNDISEYLNIPKSEIGTIKDGKIDTKQVTITTIQSVAAILSGIKRIRKTKTVDKVLMAKTSQELRAERKQKKDLINELTKYFERINFLIVDEFHEYSSDDRINTLKRINNTEFNLFLSATTSKSENLFANLALRGIIGDILYEIPEKTLKERGVLARDKVVLLKIKHDENKQLDFNNISGYQDFLDKVVINNDFRNQICVNTVEICRKLMLKTLVLCGFKRHGYNISDITGDLFVNGDDKLADRLSIKDNFLEKDGGVLIASNIFNKGLTLPEVEVLFNVGGGKEQSNLIQKKGRVLGTTETKKKALIIDFLDESEYFADHSLSRLEVYEQSTGIENIIVFDVLDKEFYRELREYIKQWFHEDL